jgi:CheY-like chemotaxis protein
MASILLVEDNLHMQRIFQQKLQREGFQVTTACDGVDGLARATETHPDAILLDIMLPRLDGFQVLGKMRDDPALRNIPVFILSYRASNEDIELATSLGARHYFAKGSSTLLEIASKLRSACGLKKVLLFTTNNDTAAPIVAEIAHPQVLCSVITVPLEMATSAERGNPDLMIIDGRAPKAFTLIQQVRLSPQAKQIPLIAIRDHNQTAHRLDGFVDSDRIDTELRPLVWKTLALADPAVAASVDLQPSTVSA